MIADYSNDEIHSQNGIDDLPDNWEVQPIIKLCKRIVDYRGKTPQFSNSGIIHLRSSNVKNGSLVLNGVTYVSEETYKAFMTRGFPKTGDVIFTTEGPLGEAALVPDNFTFSLAQRMIVLQVDEEILDSTYLMYALYSRRVRNDYFGRATGATVKGISSKTFQKVRIPFPPLPEQRAIAHTLRTIQKAKEARQRELELERERKAALMQYLFTHGTRNEPRKKTEIGDIPESWQVVKLGKVCKFLQYGTSKKCDLDSSGLPVLRIPNVIGGKIETGDLKFVKLSSNEVESLMLNLGDLLFVRTNGRREYTGRCAVFSGELQEALFASYLIRARLDTEHLLPEFAQFYTMTYQGKKYLSERASSASDGKFNINTQTIKSVLIPKPDIDEQGEIINALQASDHKITALEQEAVFLDELFRAMLEELMTGQLSTLPIAEN